MYAERHAVTIVTATGGAGTGWTPVVNGRVLHIRYVKTDYTNGVTFAITGETTGAAIWSEVGVNASTERVPRQATHSTAGVAALYAGSGTAVLGDIVLANERIQIAVTAGGDAHTGTFYVTVG